MSQINDALRKAKLAQVNAPVRESAPQLRSPETDHPVRSATSLMLPAIIVVVGLAVAALVWVAMSGRNPDTPKAGFGAGVNSSSPASSPEPAGATAREVVSMTPAAVPTATPKPEPAVVIPPAPGVAASDTVSSPPAPALPRLNGIFFNPTRPTAIVNNKLVSTGSRVGEFTVLVISQASVTFVGGGQTNVLSLSE